MQLWLWKRDKQWEGKKQPNQESIWTFGEKKNITRTLEYWKRTQSNKPRWQKKLEKNLLEKQENFLRPSFAAKKSNQRNRHLSSPFCKIHRTILKMEWWRTKIIDDSAQGLICARWYKQERKGNRTSQHWGWLDVSIQGFEDYIQKSKERLITAASNVNSNIWANIIIAKTRNQKCKDK